MFPYKTAELDGSVSAGDGIGCGRSAASSSMYCSVRVILALMVL